VTFAAGGFVDGDHRAMVAKMKRRNSDNCIGETWPHWIEVIEA
jgi:hypothetical protein